MANLLRVDDPGAFGGARIVQQHQKSRMSWIAHVEEGLIGVQITVDRHRSDWPEHAHAREAAEVVGRLPTAPLSELRLAAPIKQMHSSVARDVSKGIN